MTTSSITVFSHKLFHAAGTSIIFFPHSAVATLFVYLVGCARCGKHARVSPKVKKYIDRCRLSQAFDRSPVLFLKRQLKIVPRFFSHLLLTIQLAISNSFPSAMNICFSRFQVYATMHMLSVANFQNGGQAK